MKNLWKNLSFICAISFVASCTKTDSMDSSIKSKSSTSANGKIESLETTKTPKSVCYVEVNNYSIANVGAYTHSDGSPLFDIGIIFASNINYDSNAQKPVIYHNENVQNTLDNVATLIKPLQDKGIKVLFSLLGNHQGVGISNFTSRTIAHDFAEQIAQTITTYNLDGVDFDDEYADYGQHSPLQNTNDSSFMILLSELKPLIPNKLITFYNIGPSTSYLSYNGNEAGSYIDYAWNPYYGTYSAPSIPGLGNAALGAAAVDVTSTSSSTATAFAEQTVTDGYGIYLFYNLDNTDRSTYLSNVSNKLYGSNTLLSGTLQ